MIVLDMASSGVAALLFPVWRGIHVTKAFGRAGDRCHPMLIRPTGGNGLLNLQPRPVSAILLSRMAVTGNMIAQLSLSLYAECLPGLESGSRAIACMTCLQDTTLSDLAFRKHIEIHVC